MTDTQRSQTISTKLQKIAELARREPKAVVTNLSHHVDLEWLQEAQRRTRKDGASGIDGQSAKDYEENLQENLRGLLDRFKSGSYRAPAVKRVLIPKGDGQTRPIGIPTYEDKVLQRAVVMVLEEIYEHDFVDSSFGFRRSRSAHQALEFLRNGLMQMAGGFVIEIDIASFFDTIDHGHLRNFIDQRVRDGVVCRTIGKWLNAGVMDEGVHHRGERGSPQGGVISPLLANIYLHEVLDVWFEQQVKPRLSGAAFMVRYADDSSLVFANESDARKVFEVLPKRFAKYGLQLHPLKTKLIDFRRPKKNAGQTPKSFDMLGFTHFWGKSRNGKPVVQRKTAGKSFRRAVLKVTQWCREHRHSELAAQHQALVRKVRGHYAYFGITGNARMLGTFLYLVQRAWRKWLDRRSQRARMNWERFKHVLKRYPLPNPRIVHSIYNARS